MKNTLRRNSFTTRTEEPPEQNAQASPFDVWLEYFEANPRRQLSLESAWDHDAAVTMNASQRRALGKSFQRFELGEGGEGDRLLSKARQAGDPIYTRALELLVVEEQKHSALFALGLRRMRVPLLHAHWSDAAFTRLRRALGLRTELALFLIAEATAMEYFEALAEGAPDAILCGIGERISTDEREHLRFQTDRLRLGFADTPRPMRICVGLLWRTVALGAATVLCIDHAGALKACGRSPREYWVRAVSRFGDCATSALNGRRTVDGPSVSC
ncbi:hypothetical protein VR010_03560 [Actinomycetaceae bacterium L2_0104]